MIPPPVAAARVEVRMQDHRRAGILEHAAIAGVQVALGRLALGQQNVVSFELDMVVGYGVALSLALDAGAVDQQPRRDQSAVEQNGVVRRYQQVAAWCAVGECIGTEPDRLHLLGCRMAPQIEVALADPAYRPRGAGQRHHAVADPQILHRDLPRSVRMRVPRQ